MSEIATCPRCDSPSIQAVVVNAGAMGSAIITEALLGQAAASTVANATVVRMVCLKCGQEWRAGSPEERLIRAESGQLGDEGERILAEHRAESDAEAERQKYADAEKTRVVIVLSLIAVLILGLIGTNN